MTTSVQDTLANVKKLSDAQVKLEKASTEVDTLIQEVQTNIHDLAKQHIARLKDQNQEKVSFSSPAQNITGWVLWHNPCEGKRNHGYKLVYEEENFWMVYLDPSEFNLSAEKVTVIYTVKPNTLDSIRLLMDILGATVR